MKRKVKSIRKTMWGVYWKLHDKRKRLVARLKGYLDGLPPETRRRIVLGMLAAFALGAEGVQVGTRFLTVEECCIADAYKERVLKAKDSDTVVTGRGSGHPVRGLKNKWARAMRKLECDAAANPDELEGMYAGSLRRAVEGDVDGGSMMAGQSAALVHERKTAAQAIADLLADAEVRGGLNLQQLACANAQRTGRAACVVEGKE